MRPSHASSTLLLCAVGVLAAQAAWAIDAIVIEAGRIGVGSLQLEQADLRLDIARDGSVGAQLRIATLDAGAPFGKSAGLSLDCARLALDAPAYGCAQAVIALARSPVGPVAITSSLGFHTDTGVVSARSERVALAGGHARFDLAQGPADRWKIDAALDGATWSALRPLLADFFTIPKDLAFTGRLDAKLALQGRAAAIERGHVEASAQAVEFSNDAATLAGEKLGLRTAFDFTPGKAGRLGIKGSIAGTAGQALTGPVFFDFGAHPLTASFAGTWADSQLDLERIELSQPGVIAGSGRALLSFGTPVLVKSAQFDLPQVTLPGAYTAFLQIALAGTDFGALATRGTLAASVVVADDAPVRFDARLAKLEIVDTHGKLRLDALRGALHWAPPGQPGPAPSLLEWNAIGAYGLAGGAASVELVAQGAGFEFTKPARIPVLDGAVAVRALAVSNLGTDRLALTFEGDIEPISMPKLAQAFGWPEFAGRVSGRVPRIELRDKLLTFGGDLEASIFNGTVVASHVRMQDPLGRWPRLFADVRLRNLDLLQVTDTFEIGSISGRLDGQLLGLELFDWAPVAFDASLQTTPGYKGPRKISARAVGSLSNIGGGGGGVVSALQSGVFKAFDEYQYDRIGLRCRLADDVCNMGGVEPAPNGYYIVKGRGLPRINIIGNEGRVNWPQLVSQIAAQMNSTGKVRIE
jgi:hypothetical protein